MRKKQVAICDTNAEFAEKLQEYWKETGGPSCRTEFYTDPKRFMEYVLAQRPYACVISEDLARDEDYGVVAKYCEKVVVLCEDKDGLPPNGIYRYQNGDVLARQLNEVTGIGNSHTYGCADRSTKLVGVYTPIGRCLQTSFTLVLGQMLASKYKVLYLNFESFSGFSQMMQRNFHSDMADLLYFLKNLSQDFSHQFENAKQNINGLDFVPPAFSYIDISQVLPGEWERFFDELGKQGEYDFILLDLTDYVQGLYQILRSCSHVYTITRNDGMALAKIAHYEDVLKELSYEDIIEKTKKCSFPIYRQLPANMEELIHSDLADYVRKILREDFDFR